MLRYWLIPLGIALALTWLFWQLTLQIPLAWWGAINCAAFLTFGYDKAISGSQHTRVPEIVLLALAFVGGYVGAFLGMLFFRHKTIKTSFQLKFWAVTILSITLTIIIWIWWSVPHK